MGLDAQGVAGLHLLEADRSCDVTREYLFSLFTLVGVHLQDPADALSPTLAGVVHVAAGG